MPVSPPTADILEHYNSTSVNITRRVECYEQDGVTKFTDQPVLALIDGSISVDYTRDERRSLDLTISNPDNLKPQPGGLWYDKVIKVFHGITFDKQRFASLATTNLFWNPSFSGGIGDVSQTGFNLLLSTSVYDYGHQSLQCIPSGASTPSVNFFQHGTTRAPVIAGNYYVGSLFIKVRVLGGTTGKTFTVSLKYYNSGGSVIGTFNSPTYSGSGGWQRFIVGGQAPAGAVSALMTLTQSTNALGDYFYVDAIQLENQSAATSFCDGDQPNCSWTGTPNASTSSRIPISAGYDTFYWECQVGEFLIDDITTANFPNSIKISGRDYTKKCLLSKFTQPLTFSAGSSPEELIQDMAANCGIFNVSLPNTNVIITSDLSFDANSSRWTAMKKIANDFGYELFFDATGYLIMRPFQDPVITGVSFIYQTGPNGNLVGYSKKISDANLFNHVAVTGASNSSTLPAFAEVFNNEASSPTNVSELGDRLYSYQSDVIVSNDQALAVAYQLLSIQGLETYDVSLSACVFPWLEAGSIIQFIDPDPVPGDPDRFLLSTISIPLKLGQSSLSVKRVTIVGTLT